MQANSIRTQEVMECLLCRKEGVPFHVDLPDRLFGVPGLWSFRKCPECGLVWLSPRPIGEDIGATYTNYYTHDAADSRGRMEVFQERVALPVLASGYSYRNRVGQSSRGAFFGRLLSWIPPFNDIARRYVMNLRGDTKGRLLDVGCGDGKFLAVMRAFGWDVSGIEPDSEAARAASQRLGVPVFAGNLGQANFPSHHFDAVTMKHVIEHGEDPLGLVRECHRVLKPGGRLSVATPNIDCLQHRFFGPAWLELDPPRHLHLFSSSTLLKLLELAIPGGFAIEDLRTVSANTAQISVVSRAIKRGGEWRAPRLSQRQLLEGLLFLAVEEGVKLFRPRAGEEILVTAIKSSGAPVR